MRHHPRTHGHTAARHRCLHHDTAMDEPPTEGWLQPGEHVHAEIQADAWRYLALDVPYDHRTILFGGPIGWICSGIASAIGNRRTRQAAERLAAPQWRHLGHIPIIVTNQRLLVWYEDDWRSVWLDIVERYDLREDVLVLTFYEDPPYCLRGSDLSAVMEVLHLAKEPTAEEVPSHRSST